MLEAVTSALAGLSAAPRRFDAAANDSFNEETRGAGAPSPSGSVGGVPASGAPGSPPPEDPRAVEETASPSRGPAASFRSITPSYLSVLDPSLDPSDGESDGALIRVNVEAAQTDETNPDASDSSAVLDLRERSEADQQAIRVTNELVRRLYDLG